MPSNGIFDRGILESNAIETWDTYTGDSAGNDWDSILTWNGTANLPLTYTTSVLDFGRKDYVNFLTEVASSNAVTTTTITYGDSVDSAGAIISTGSVTVNPGDSVSPVQARYFQFSLSLDQQDSAGSGLGSHVQLLKFTSTLTSEKATQSITSLNSNTLPGSVGERQLALTTDMNVISAVCQPHFAELIYVEKVDDSAGGEYVSSEDSAGALYVEERFETPMIYINKATDPITLNIVDLDTYGKSKRIDCVFDAVVTGLPKMTVDGFGSIRRS